MDAGALETSQIKDEHTCTCSSSFLAEFNRKEYITSFFFVLVFQWVLCTSLHRGKEFAAHHRNKLTAQMGLLLFPQYRK